ncbi:hypothetical protein BSLG_010774 [Batrachochytrium salamandrivorans]|nr:hypothetical protein BSLG_010774 [Batrachochytrium salamandrivorans]
MVAVSLILVLALVSSTVVAQSGTNGFAEIIACFGRRPTFVSTESIHRVKTSFTDNLGITHLYGIPLHEGSFIRNPHAATHVKNGQVFLYSATIKNNPRLTKRSPTISKSTVKISSRKAVKAAVDCLDVPFYHDITPVKESYSTDDGDILVWVFQLRDNPITRWFEVKVDVITELPDESPYDGFSTVVDPENLQSSPNGWTKGFKLKGNNAEAKYKKGKTFKTTTKGMFDGTFDPLLPPQISKNLIAGAVNAFYVANTFHDVLYAYGFNEPAGNFQRDNFKRGGIGEDPVIINVQDSKDANNAFFYTPPDGQPGVLNLHIFTATEPHRDPALDNTVIVHELTHGLSDRLTGGAQTKMCMSKIESGGLSEGYSDMIVLIFTAKPKDTRNTRRVMGEYAEGDQRGSRRYPYTTNMKVNPLAYQDVAGEKQRHALGEIWAVMLFEVYWNFVDAYGFSANLHDATQKEGNIIFLQLLVGTLMIQPCNPTFIFAYHAMLAADDVYYGGVHKHLIIKGFAKRGLGSIS